MAKWKIVAIAFLLLLPVLNREARLTASDAKELALQAEKKLDEGSRLADQDKLAEAAAVYLQAAELYEQALKQDANNSASRQNFVYSLGERAMIYIRKGQSASKEKKYALASDLYGAAIAAFDLALKKLPQQKNFQTNRSYCRHEWGLAQFQVKLAAGGSAFSFQLTGLDGAPIKLPEMKGQVVLLEFAAGWSTVEDHLRRNGVLGGLNLEPFFPELKDCALLCVTEVHKKDDIDTLARLVGEVLR